MANITRIKNNQITDATITYAKIASGTLTGSLFNPSLTLSSNVTILGNLSVTGNTSTINSTNTYVNDPLIVFNNGYTGSPTYDIGMIANRNLQNLTGYGSVNTAFVWKEADASFQAIATTETGTTTGSITNSGWANVKVGNLTALTTTTGGLQAVSIGNITPGSGAFTTGTFSSTLGVTGATTLTTATAGGLQVVAIGNVTPGTGVFTTGTFDTATAGGLQAVAIGNVTPGTGVFTTGTFNTTTTGGLQAVAIGNATPGTSVFTTTSTGGLQAVAIGNVAPGTGAFTTATAGGLQAQAIGNVTPGTGVFTTGTFNTATTGGLQAVAIGNATPGTGAFTTATAGGLQAIAIGNVTPGTGAFISVQAQAIGNVTPGTGAFTTLTAQTETVGGLQAVAIGNVTPGTAAFTTATTNGLQAVAIGNVTPGTAAFTTGTFSSTLGVTGATTMTTATAGGLQAVAIGNVTPGTGVFTTGTFNTATTGGLQAVAIGNVTPGTGAFTTITATTVNAAFIGNSGAVLTGDGGLISNISLGSIAGTYPTANVSMYDSVSATTTNATFYPQLVDKTTGNVAAYTASGVNVNPSTSTINALAFAGGTGSFTTGAFSSTLGVTGATTMTTATTGGLQAQAIGNVTPGTGVFTTGTFNTATTGGLQAVAIGNATPGTGAFTTATAGSFQGIVGNAAATTAFFTTANATNVYAATIGNASTSLNGSTATVTNWANITGTTAATSTTTGALIVAGGVGVAGNIYSGYTLTAANIVTSGSNGNISGVSNLFTANVIATNVNAVTIGNTGAAITGATGTFNTATVGGLQAVAIGNATPGTAAFTTATAGSLQGIIGNATATTAFFTTANATTVQAATIGNVGAAHVGASATLTGTVIAATINAATIGNVGASVVGNGGFLSNIIGANVVGTVTTSNVAMYENVATSTTNAVYYPQLADKASGNVASVVATGVNVNPSTSTISALGFAGGTGAFTTLSASGVTQITNSTASTSTETGALQVTGGAGILGNLWVGGNIYAGNIVATTTNMITVQDPLLYLQALGNLSYYNYDIGFYSDYTANQYRHSGLARSFASNTWIFFSNVFSEPSGSAINWNDVGLAYDTVKAGSLILANATAATSSSSGALQVAGGIGVIGSAYIGGGIQNTIIGNATPATAFFTTANATNVYAATVGNASTTLNGNLVGGNASLTSTTAATSTTTGALVVAGGAGVAGNVYIGGSLVTTGASGNISGVNTVFTTTVNATSINSATIGNIGAVLRGDGGLISNISLGSISGTYPTANVALYDQITNLSNNQTYYLGFANVVSGNSTIGAVTTVNVNPSTGTVSATSVSATSVSATTATTSGTIIASGNIVAAATTASTDTTTGSFIAKGGAGIAGALNVGGNGSVTGTLNVTGATTMTTATAGGLQAQAIGNVTPGTGVFTTGTFNTATTGGLQAVAIGNATPGTAAFTTATTGGLQAVAIGNVTPGSGAFTTLSTTGNLTVGGNIAVTGNIVPSANVTYSLGTSGNRFKDIWLSGQTEYLGGSVIGEDSDGNLTLTTATGNRLTIASTSNVIVATGNVTTPYLLGNVYGTTGTFLGTGTSTSKTTGAVVVTGGVGISGAVNIGTSLTVDNGTYGNVVATQFGSLYATANSPNNYALLQAWSPHTGGGLGLNAFGNIVYSAGAITFHTGATIRDKDYPTGGITKVQIAANGAIINTTGIASTSTGTGAVIVTGGAGISGNINVGSNAVIDGYANVAGAITAGATSSVHALQGNLLIGPTQGANSADSPLTINQNTETPILFPNAVIHVSSLSGKTAYVSIDTFGTFAPPVTSGFFSRRARGTSAAPSAVQATDTLGGLLFKGYGTTAYTTGAYQASGITVGAAENFSDNSQATYMNFYTTNTGSNTATMSMFIDYTGNVVVNAATTSTSTTSGALTVKGGVGIAGTVNIGGNTAVNNTLYAQGLYDNGTRVVSTSSGAGNLTISGTAINMTPVGPGAVTTGSASAVPVITTDAYGRITAITTAEVAAVATAANVAFYTQTVSLNNNATFYPTFANVNGGNSIPGTSSLLSYNPGTGTLTASAAAVNGGLTSTSYTDGALVVTGGVGISGAVNTNSGITAAGKLITTNNENATSTSTGAIQATGGISTQANLYVGKAAIFNSSQTAGMDVVARGVNDATLIWARPSASYDTVIIGNSATASTVVAGAKLNINTTDSILLPIGTNSQRPGNQGQTDVAGMFRYSSTQNAVEWYTGTQWVAATTQFTVITDEQFNGDGSTVAFTLAGATTTASTIVSINGVMQIPTLAYAVTGGTTLTFTEAPASGDIIDVRRLTTTETVIALNDPTGYNAVDVDNVDGVTLSTGTAAKNARFRINTDGAQVSLLANTAIASANVATTIDTMATGTYRSAKYTVQATNGASYQVLEALLISNGTTATVMAYGTIQTNGNLGIVTATQSGSNALLQFTALNSSTNVRITKEYLLI